MNYPITTGELARLLQTTEPQLGETVRRGRVVPAPAVVSGRRRWTREQALQAAEALGRPASAALAPLPAGNELEASLDQVGTGEGQP